MSKEYTAFNGDAFWNDGYVQELDLVETAVYFHYITSPRLENSGVFKEGRRMAAFYVKTDVDAVKNAEAKLEKDGKIYRIGEWVVVPSSLKHQKFDKSPNIIKGVYEQLKTAPAEVLRKLQECGYGLDLTPIVSGEESDSPPNPSEPLPEPLPNPSGTLPLYSDSYSDSYKEFKESINSQTYSPEKPENLNLETSEKVFLRIWLRRMDIFNSMARIEKPKEWAAFWEKCPYPPDDIERRMQNFIDGVKNGSIEKRFVPRTPDRFVLKGHLNASDAPYKKNENRGGLSPPSNITDKKSIGGLE
ncbi:MAG: hypothetical protein LBK73_16755 [Treponema sp.]|jgi:hypothetical protein|nr:hypothetical protein [Treponema sp.]